MRVTLARANDAELIQGLTHAAFEEYRGVLNPPSSVHTETLADVQQSLTRGGAVIAWLGEDAVGCARYEPRAGYLYVGRVSVLPDHRRKGVGSALMQRLADLAPLLGLYEIHVGVRESLPGNIRFYESLGFEVLSVEQHPRGPDKTIWMVKRIGTEPP